MTPLTYTGTTAMSDAAATEKITIVPLKLPVTETEEVAVDGAKTFADERSIFDGGRSAFNVTRIVPLAEITLASSK
jgi:hypothetical protein